MTSSRTSLGTHQVHEWLDPETLSAEILVPVRTLYSWRARGLGPQAVRIGKHLRYTREAVNNWLDEQIDEQARERPAS